MLRNLVVALAATAAMVGGNAGATTMSAPAAMRAAADSLNMVENVQFFWTGHNYCWYDDGWNGPGWYWCDMYLQPGIGWGGGYGWHSWRGGHPHSYYQGNRGSHVGGAVTRSSGSSKAVTRSSSRAVEQSLVAVAAAAGRRQGWRRQGRRKKVTLFIAERGKFQI